MGLGLALVPALATTFRSTYGLNGWDIANLQNFKDFGAITLVIAGPIILRQIGPFMALNTAILTGIIGSCIFVIVPNFKGLMLGTFLHGASFALGTMAIVTILFQLPVAFRRISAMFAAYGIASFTAPASVGLLVTIDHGYNVVYQLYALVLAPILVVGVLLWRVQSRYEKGGAVAETARFLTKRQLSTWAFDLAAYSALMATETIVATWIMSLAQYTYAASVAGASALLSILWAVHAGVRLCGDVLASWLSPRFVILCGAATAICGITILCLGSMTLAYIGAIIFAIGMAAGLPIYQGWILSQIPSPSHPPMNAALSIAGTFSLTVMIWLTGLMVDIDTRLPFVVAAALLLYVVCHVARIPKRTPELER